jgi:hypothetical protein
MTAFYRLAEQGGTPVDLPEVLRDGDWPYTPVGGIQITAGGGAVSQIVTFRRTFPLNFGVITDAQLAELRKWWDRKVTGWHGYGPFVLYEGDAAGVLVNLVAYDPKPAIRGLVRMSMTLQEVYP